MLYIIQNGPDVPPGLLTEELIQFGVKWTTVHPYRGEALPELPDTEAVIVLGGDMGANDDGRHPFLTPLKAFMRVLVDKEIPYLGICLGGQLLAAALGADVTSNVHGEKGTCSVSLTGAGAEDRLFRGVSREFVSFQWHDDSFAVPDGAIRLAFSEACPNQAFRIGPSAWGLQFHPEVDERIVRVWSSWTPGTSSRTDEIVAAYRAAEAEYCQVLRLLTKNFLMACQQ